MDKKCFNCYFARLIYNKKERDKYVGCIKHNGDEKELIESLDKANYVNVENSNEVMYGWIYARLYPSDKREDFDSVDGGTLANLCLITPYDSYCDLFQSKT